ncbi:cytochrome c biogenesis protein ResB [Actinocrinis puniceicyclus]|uniref:Cytochrome c biogenesis protein ResB n=1 Tax=Actinocrinis puniceicyclus TaxID=977794 RepID=A0A8J7WMJ3_9ACTN|nr:cytochrome c biogenesis protein ResB [Actinocrinis puniceicyclus]MBS2962179.1 cytochrome c biogenesis protein ResB [Actinocrinis puniceicyclus]
MTEQQTDKRAEGDAPDAQGAPAGDVGGEFAEAGRLSTAPRPDTAVAVPRLGTRELLRWMWRQLTSMRIALTLLFLLSVAAIPGSLLPQREIDPSKVLQFFGAHKTWAPILDRLQLFDVFESVWFGAIYVLLFVSLVGCILPRSVAHYLAMRGTPPAAPRNLKRLPVHASFRTGAPAEQALAAAGKRLKHRRFRTAAGTDTGGAWVAAEKGYLRETGNLVFHLALLGILVAVAIGHFFGFKGARLVTEGTGFCDTVAGYDSLTKGQAVSDADLPPFCIRLDKFTASYQESGDQIGQPRTFDAYATYQASPSSPQQKVDVRVNEPITVNGTNIFLEGHGYAPVVTVKDGEGKVVYDGPVTFLGIDANFTSNGAIKVPDAKPKGLGFQGYLLPTALIMPGSMPASVFPAAQNPVLILTAYAGNLNMDSGESQSVYTLDTSRMTRLDVKNKKDAASGNALMLAVGQSATLPNGLGSITFDGVKQWAQFNIAYDPGQPIALGSAAFAVLGLVGSLGIRRRRIWVRVSETGDGARLVEVAGLARTEGATPTAEVTQAAEALAADLGVVPDEHEQQGKSTPRTGASA